MYKFSDGTIETTLDDYLRENPEKTEEDFYLGHLIQGKTERINYKVKKCVEKPKEEWVRVENTHKPIISADDFRILQNLLQADGRVSPDKKELNPFMGLLFCGDCREQMVRRVNRYKGTSKVYYICSSKNRGEGCSQPGSRTVHKKEKRKASADRGKI